MAFFDDRRFILSHIRHSFITCDDTGLCEMALLNETMPHHLPGDPGADLADTLEVEAKSELLDAAQSYDIVSDMVEMIGAHRRRCNTETARRLESLKKERKSQAKVKFIQWKDNPLPLSDAELTDFFPKKDLPYPISAQEKKKQKSALSAQIERYPAIPNNPFNEFARFDGRVSEGAPTKLIVIFLTMLSPDERGFPMEVITSCNARVQDLIGLICWQYTNENKEPKLKHSVNNYCLRIAEETGEVDPDFPSLNPKENVAKFGFPCLALVEKEEDVHSVSLVVTVHIEEMFSKLQAPNLQVNLQWVLEQTLKKRNKVAKSAEYRLESIKEPGIPLDLSTPLADADGREFKLLRDDDLLDEMQPIEVVDLPDMCAIEAPLYKTYTVSAVHKLGRSADVQLGISGKKVDVNPFPNKNSSKLWSWQPKAASYNVEAIADCEIMKIHAGKATFKLSYHTGHEFQSIRFETDTNQAQEIVKKLKHIMTMRSSSIREEFVAIKEQKMLKKMTHLPGFV